LLQQPHAHAVADDDGNTYNDECGCGDDLPTLHKIAQKAYILRAGYRRRKQFSPASVETAWHRPFLWPRRAKNHHCRLTLSWLFC
jgi:hypothetical protein